MGRAAATRSRASAGGDLPELLERERELAEIDAALVAAREGEGRLLFVEAHAGLGKTGLLAAAAKRGAEAGLEVLTARGAELERGHPFGAAVQLLEGRLWRASDEERAELLAGAAAPARSWFDPQVAATATLESQLLPLLHGLYWLVANIAERRPLLLVLDDAHWVDPSTLRFVLYLQQRLDELPVSVVVATRPAEPGAPVELLRQLDTHPRVRRLAPSPLGPAAARRLVSSRMAGAEEAFAEACSELTRGNPFLLNELLAGLLQEGVRPTVDAARRLADHAPDSLLTATLVRVARLPGAAAAVARAVAILGDDARLRHTAQLAGISYEVAADSVDALTAAEILQPGEPLSFVHPLLHSSIYGDVPVAERSLAHGRAARLLAEEDVAPARLAAHLLAAERKGSAWTVDTLRAAADDAIAHGSAESAARYLARALEEPPTPQERAAILIALGEAEAAGGQPQALERIEAALALEGEPRRRAEILLRLGWMLHQAGQLEAAADTLERARSELDGEAIRGGLGEGTDPLRHEIDAAFLGGALLEPRHAEKASLLARRMEAPSGSLGPAKASLLAGAAGAHVFAGDRRDRAIEFSLRVLADRDPSEQEGLNMLALLQAIGCLSWCDELDEAEHAIELAIDAARRRANVVALALWYYARSWPRWWRGRVSEAAADAQAAVDAWSQGFGMYLPTARFWLASSLLELGEIEAAGAAAELGPNEEHYRDSVLYATTLAGRGRVAAARGQPAAALERFLAAGEIMVATSIVDPAPIPWRSEAALAAARLGESERALELAGEELRLARRFGTPRAIGIALRAKGLVIGGDAGIDLVHEAVATLRTSPSALELVRALVDLGGLLRRKGQSRDAREPLREGLAMAQGLGTLAIEARAQEELAASGARPRRRELTGIEALTPSERRVAEMAAEGLTNREIAQSLFVTVKAVQWHLRNTYGKLEVGGREELAQALASAGR